MKSKIRSSLKYQMMFIFSMMIVAVIIVVGSVTTYLSTRYTTQNARENLNCIVADTKRTIALFFEERQLQLMSTADHPAVADFLETGEQRPFVRQLLRSQFHT